MTSRAHRAVIDRRLATLRRLGWVQSKCGFYWMHPRSGRPYSIQLAIDIVSLAGVFNREQQQDYARRHPKNPHRRSRGRPRLSTPA